MPSPFPGMDPYLEDSGLWPDVHSRLINIASEMLLAQLRPSYFILIEEHIYLADQLEMHERRLAVIGRELRKVVTIIEFLSPANKVKGSAGKQSYDQKKREILSSETNLVEIDLLRSGAPLYSRAGFPAYDYLVQVWRRGNDRHRRYIWPVTLKERLPVVPIPVRTGDDDAALDLQAVVNTAYDRAGYDLRIDYSVEPRPPLKGEAAEWARQL